MSPDEAPVWGSSPAGVRPTGPWASVPVPHAPDLWLQVLPGGGPGGGSGGPGGLTAFVRFPSGWSRSQPLACTAAEEFVVLTGSIELDGAVHRAGSLARVPAGVVRRSTSSVDGCLALAWFDAPPRWRPGDPGPTRTYAIDLAEVDPGFAATAAGTRWEVRLGSSGSPAPAAPATDRQVVDLDDPAWWAVPAGDPLPDSSHRLLVRCRR